MSEKEIIYYDYNIRYYEESLEKERVVAGLVVGHSMKDAFNRLINYYGEENVITVYIQDKYIKEVMELDQIECENNISLN